MASRRSAPWGAGSAVKADDRWVDYTPALSQT
jgi:hypothetical protein